MILLISFILEKLKSKYHETIGSKTDQIELEK